MWPGWTGTAKRSPARPRPAADPTASATGFRAVSGLVLALFITTVAVAVITTIDAKRGTAPPGQPATATVMDQFTLEKAGVPPAPSAGMLAALTAASAARGTVVIHLDTPGITIPSALIGKPASSPPLQAGLVGLVSCAQLAGVPYRDTPSTLGEIGASLPSAKTDLAYQQLADVVVLLILPIAGCTLAPPQAAYYLLTGAGVAVSLGIIAATFPLLARITGPEVARNE